MCNDHGKCNGNYHGNGNDNSHGHGHGNGNDKSHCHGNGNNNSHGHGMITPLSRDDHAKSITITIVSRQVTSS